MRLLIDTLIALMLVAVLAGVLLHYRHERETHHQHLRVHHALTRLQEQTLYHSALGEAPKSPSGFALEVAPEWFAEGVPVNALTPPRHPWLDVAPEGDAADHPPDPVILGPAQAGFWYNPARGVFRARVTPQFTDQATLDLYNRLNGTMLLSLPQQEATAGRAPRPLPRGQGPAAAATPAATPRPPATLRDADPN